MAVSALIKFVQGASVPAAGLALIGVLTTSVVVSNGDNTNVVYWRWRVIDVPAGSAVTTGVRTEGAVTTLSFSPDVRGSYYVELITRDKNGNQAVDRRVFTVLESSGRLIPPFTATDDALNFSDQRRGWAKYMEEWLHYTDTITGTTIFQEEGSTVGTRGKVNFIGGSVLAADNPGQDRVDVTVAPLIAIQEEGATVGTRGIINFIGAAVTAVDNPGSARVDVTVTAAASGGTRVSAPITTGTTVLDATQSAASVLELTGALTGDAFVKFVLTDGRSQVVVNKTTGTGYVWLQTVLGTVLLHAPRNTPIPIYCGAAELSNAGKASRIYRGTGTQPYYWWRCDEPSGSLTLVNSGTGGANPMTIVLAQLRQEAGSLLRGSDMSLRVFGAGTRSAIATVGAHAAVQSFMFGGWFRVGADGILMSYGIDHTLTMTAGLASASIARTAGAATVTTDASAMTTLGDYHNYIVGYDGPAGGVRLFVDGSVAGSSPGVSSVTYSALSAWTIGNAAGFKGMCEDIRVYDFYDAALPAAIWAAGIGAP